MPPCLVDRVESDVDSDETQEDAFKRRRREENRLKWREDVIEEQAGRLAARREALQSDWDAAHCRWGEQVQFEEALRQIDQQDVEFAAERLDFEQHEYGELSDETILDDDDEGELGDETVVGDEAEAVVGDEAEAVVGDEVEPAAAAGRAPSSSPDRLVIDTSVRNPSAPKGAEGHTPSPTPVDTPLAIPDMSPAAARASPTPSRAPSSSPDRLVIDTSPAAATIPTPSPRATTKSRAPSSSPDRQVTTKFVAIKVKWGTKSDLAPTPKKGGSFKLKR